MRTFFFISFHFIFAGNWSDFKEKRKKSYKDLEYRKSSRFLESSWRRGHVCSFFFLKNEEEKGEKNCTTLGGMT